MARDPAARCWPQCIGPTLCAWLVLGVVASAQPVVQEVVLYQDGPVPPCTVHPWSMAWEERAGGQPPTGKCLWLNTDWQAKAWAGVRFGLGGKGFELTKEWIEKGAIRFLINMGTDRHGQIGPEVRLQIRPGVKGLRYQGLRAGFVDRGRGCDQDSATWQEVLVPMSYWTTLSEGQMVTEFSVQCYGAPTLTFGLDAVSYVRYPERPKWAVGREQEDVAQPWVKWTAYGDLPECLKSDRHPPRVSDGKFVGPDGRRVFIINPYCREDARLDVWGATDESRRPPHHKLYDPDKHGWIYNELATAEGLCRLGFNSYSATMPARPFQEAMRHRRLDRSTDPERLRGFYESVRMPFYVDMVCWPWTLGSPGTQRQFSALPDEAIAQGYNHWTPYRITGKGRDAWMTMWRVYAKRYRDAKVPVLIYELMNEPAYMGVSEDHRSAFVQWLKERYGRPDKMNQTWGTDFRSWQAVVAFKDYKELRHTPGPCLDYDEFLSEKFTSLIADGIEAIKEIDPSALAGVQTMGGYALQPREAVWKHKFTRFESVVITPTGGGRWSPGSGNAAPNERAIDSVIAGAPLENDLLLALAKSRMIFDNETYLRGQKPVEVRNRLWEQVISGLDGLSVFSWSKRGWVWWKTRDKVRLEADKFPYCNLNPFAKTTESLRGILDFSLEIQPIADRILRKPWGPAPRIALLYDWAQARRAAFDRRSWDKTAYYHAALRYTHWNFAMLPSDRAIAGALKDYEVLVVGGVTHIEPQMLPALTAFVERGGTLVVGEELFAQDIYGGPLSTKSLLGVGVSPVAPAQQDETVEVPDALAPAALPGAVRLTAGEKSITPLPGTEVLIRSNAGSAIVTRSAQGKGHVYFQAADIVGYRLAKVLWAILTDAAAARGDKELPVQWRLAEIRDAATGQLAPNIILSRRSHENDHALLLMNHDRYDKTVHVRLAGLDGQWRVTNGLSSALIKSPDGGTTWSARNIAEDGMRLKMPAGHPVVLLVERAE